MKPFELGPSGASTVVAGLLIMASALGIGRFAYTPLLPPLQEALGWSVAFAGDVASANFLGYLLGALLASWLAAHADRWVWLTAGMLLSAITTCAGGIVESGASWLAIRFVSGLASAFCLVFGTALVIERLTAIGKPRLGWIHFAGVGAGIVVSVAVIESTRSLDGSVFRQWAVLGFVAAVLFAPAWLLLRPLRVRPNPAQGPAMDDARPCSPDPALLRLVAAYGLFGFGYVVTATFIVAMARQLDGTAFLEPATWVTVGLLAVPSVLVWHRLAGITGMIPALRLAFVLEAGGVLLAGFGRSTVMLVAGGALLGATFMGITALGLIAARQMSAESSGAVIGLMTGAFGLGQLLGPAVSGRLAEATGGFEVPSLVAAVLLAAGAALLRAGDHETT